MQKVHKLQVNSQIYKSKKLTNIIAWNRDKKQGQKSISRLSMPPTKIRKIQILNLNFEGS